jgi:hypothetical protein
MTTFISVTDLMRSHVEPYLRLSWFLFEAIEREHRLNLIALAGTPGAMRASGDACAVMSTTNQHLRNRHAGTVLAKALHTCLGAIR